MPHKAVMLAAVLLAMSGFGTCSTSTEHMLCSCKKTRASDACCDGWAQEGTGVCRNHATGQACISWVQTGIAASTTSRVPLGMSFGFLYPDSPLWLSLPGSSIAHTPTFLEGAALMTIHHMLPPLFMLRLSCPNHALFAACTFYVFVYDCGPPCSADSDVASVASVLLPLGFRQSRCAPTFRQQPGGQAHAMKAFVKTVGRGSSEEIETQQFARYLALAMVADAIDCGAHTTPLSCSVYTGTCVWVPSKGECQSTSCPEGPGVKGPDAPTVCGTCPSTELGLL